MSRTAWIVYPDKIPPDAIHQRDFVEEATNEYLVAAKYRAIGKSFSDGSIDNLKTIIEEITPRKPDVLIAYNMMCLAPNPLKLVETVQLFADHGIMCESIRDFGAIASIYEYCVSKPQEVSIQKEEVQTAFREVANPSISRGI